MSMSMSIMTVSDKDINSILDSPIKLEILIHGELDPDLLEDMREEGEEVDEATVSWRPEQDNETYGLEGAFHAVHYLLTGKDSRQGDFPLNFLLCDGIPVGEIGWGPANFYLPNDVQEICTALKELAPAEVLNRYNADLFNERKMYPRGYTWKTEDGEGLLLRLTELKSFLDRTAARGKGICITIE